MQASANVLEIDTPVFLLNVPFSLAADVPNNIWMEEMDAHSRTIDRNRAISQFFDLYRTISCQAIVYLLPSKSGLQDQVYVSNLGIVLPHLAHPTFIVSRFRSPPRIRESAVGIDFFQLMNFTVIEPPDQGDKGGEALFFEGEADLKRLRDNIYVGGHGLRSSLSAHKWFEREFAMKVIPFHMTHDRLYHLDCCVMPLSHEAAMVCVAATDKKTASAIGKYCEVVDISFDAAVYGATNNLIVKNQLIFSSNIDELTKFDQNYDGEKRRISELEKVATRFKLETVRINLSEYMKSGALLSCMVMNLNYRNYLE